jgi:membrane protease YdiL (CAAX protease family)
MAWGREAALALAAAAVLHAGASAAILWPLALWGRSVGVLPAPVPLDMTPAAILFSFLVVAPLTEELLFRGWLTGRVAGLRFALYGAAALAILLASLGLERGERGPFALVAAALVFAGLFHWGLTRRRDARVPGWFVRHFGAITWGSSLLFGLIHLGNYDGIAGPLGLLVVLPQTVGGLLLAYVRTRIGLLAAILYHAAYNGLFVVFEIAAR